MWVGLESPSFVWGGRQPLTHDRGAWPGGVTAALWGSSVGSTHSCNVTCAVWLVLAAANQYERPLAAVSPPQPRQLPAKHPRLQPHPTALDPQRQFVLRRPRDPRPGKDPQHATPDDRPRTECGSGLRPCYSNTTRVRCAPRPVRSGPCPIAQTVVVQKHKQRLWVSWVVDSIPGVLRTPATEVVA